MQFHDTTIFIYFSSILSFLFCNRYTLSESGFKFKVRLSRRVVFLEVWGGEREKGRVKSNERLER